MVKTFWATTQKGETKVEIPITGDMAPNVFVHITLLQPHASTLNDSPIRLYGIVPIEVIDKNTIIEPQISMPEILKPEEKVNIRVSEKSGKAMTYTLAIVDDGLLDLTRFKTPNAWNSFYTREALGVKTWDIFDEVIGAYGGRINQVFSIGGDEDLGGGKAKKANRFNEIDYLIPIPIRKITERTRGYNQSLLICEGIAQVMPIPILNAVLFKNKKTNTQTRKDRIERGQNTDHLFGLKNADQIREKHLLLVDDIITTGATAESAGRCLFQANPSSVQFAAAAYTLS